MCGEGCVGRAAAHIRRGAASASKPLELSRTLGQDEHQITPFEDEPLESEEAVLLALQTINCNVRSIANTSRWNDESWPYHAIINRLTALITAATTKIALVKLR